MGFFVGFTENAVALFFQLFLFFLGLLFETFDLAFVRSDSFLLLFNSSAAGFQIGQEIFKGFVLFSKSCLSILNNEIGSPSFPAIAKALLYRGFRLRGGKWDEVSLRQIRRRRFQLPVWKARILLIHCNGGSHCTDTAHMKVI